MIRKVLIIDDEEFVRLTLGQILKKAGFDVIDAANGELGLRKLRQGPVDLVITDIIMPEKEGIETIIEIRRDYPDLPIVAISGGGRSGNTDFLKVAKAFGAKETLQKPFRVNEVLDAVHGALGAARAA